MAFLLHRSEEEQKSSSLGKLLFTIYLYSQNTPSAEKKFPSSFDTKRGRKLELMVD
jgi:hypothetical protein